MPRYRLTIEYDGGPFCGWQRQKNGPSVQQTLEEAIEKLTGETVRIGAAGRTDTGVHALGQVAHVDLSKDWITDTLRDGLNAHLRPAPVAILAAEAVDDDFDARFSARRRHYLYRILNRRAPPVVEAGRAWGVPTPLDCEAMHVAAQLLVGHHDFTTFRAANCQAESPMKTLDRLDVARAGDEITVRAVARSFLHSQVRSMVGTLVKVGEGRWAPAEVGEVLEARDRTRCGPLAPACGLYLMAVDY